MVTIYPSVALHAGWNVWWVTIGPGLWAKQVKPGSQKMEEMSAQQLATEPSLTQTEGPSGGYGAVVRAYLATN